MLVRVICTLFFFALVVNGQPVSSQEQKIDGYFLARQKCPALQSIRTQQNPADVHLEINKAYDLISKNNRQATHMRIVVPGAKPKERWVSVSCGERVLPVGPLWNKQPGRQPTKNASLKTRYVLAVSWQPAFCETRPNKPECVSQTVDRFDANHFSLHGLWPQPRSNTYCRVSSDLVTLAKNRKWEQLPDIVLPPQLRTELNKVMPGTQSFLDRYEWIKHGTCYNGQPQQVYYQHSLKLLAALNASTVRDLFQDAVGATISAETVRQAFDTAFGPGTGERVRLSCARDGGRRLIKELTIGLGGEIANDARLSDLLRAARPVSAGCPGGIVDPAGFQ